MDKKLASAEAQIGKGVADMVEFEAQINRHEATEKANRIQAWQGLLDLQLADRFDRDRPVLLLPGPLWSGQHEPEVRLRSQFHPLHRYEFDPPKFFSKTFKFSIIFYTGVVDRSITFNRLVDWSRSISTVNKDSPT